MRHYDLSELEAMAQGNTEFVGKMVTVFLETTTESLDEMLVCVKEDKLAQIGRLAHKIKPSIDLMGIDELKGIVRETELKGKAENESVRELVPELERVLRLVFEEMKEDYK